MAKWPQRNPLRLLFQWRGWKSTLSPSFITFSEREPFLRGFLCWNCWNFWSQRCIWVSKRWGKRNFSKGSQFDHFPLLWRKPTLSICFLRPNCFHISPLDGGPQHMFHVTLCWFHLFKVLKVCKYKCYFSWSILIGFKFKGTLVNVFQRSISHMRACFFQFHDIGAWTSHFWWFELFVINL